MAVTTQHHSQAPALDRAALSRESPSPSVSTDSPGSLSSPSAADRDSLLREHFAPHLRPSRGMSKIHEVLDRPAVKAPLAMGYAGLMLAHAVGQIIQIGLPAGATTLVNITGDFSWGSLAVPLLTPFLRGFTRLRPFAAEIALATAIAYTTLGESIGGAFFPGHPDPMDIPFGIGGIVMGYALGRNGLRELGKNWAHGVRKISDLLADLVAGARWNNPNFPG